jgi:hypothetical protein
MISSIEEGRKEDGNRSIADKIIKRLHDLDLTVENNQGRWAWELLQNAKDSIAEEDDRKISVKIILNENTIEVQHNGAHFTELDIRGLINQISSKEVEEGQQSKNTGRFGTGFLTTHLLSRCIQIKGIVQTISDGFCHFDFLLDRQGKTTKELAPKIENAWQAFQESIEIIGSSYDKSSFNTSFCYFLESERQSAIAKIGIEEFSKCVPFVMAFIPKIYRVEIIDTILDKNSIFRNPQVFTDDFIASIEKDVNGVQSEILILHAISGKVSVATEVEKIETGYSVKSIADIPKIFCDFPLIGTENFHFPVIVNSFYFHPQTERDGIWLKGNAENLEAIENQELFVDALALYKKLISHLEGREFFDLYNLVESRMPTTNENYFDAGWYKEFIQKPLREFIIDAKIVELEGNKSHKKSIKELGFPLKDYSKLIQAKTWDFLFDLQPDHVCRKEHLHKWCNLTWDGWNSISYQSLINFLVQQENIEKLSQSLKKDESATYDWFNSLCKFILEDETNEFLFEKHPTIPNQNGNFRKKTELYIDEIENDDFVRILGHLGEDWKEQLLSKQIKFGEYHSKNKKDIAAQITDKINKASKDDSLKDDSFIKAVSLLSEWLDNNPEQGKELFSELYSKRAELFMNTIEDKESLYKVMRSGANLREMSELNTLLTDMNVSNVSELRDLLESSSIEKISNSPVEITREILLSLGVTSIKELEEVLMDSNLSAQFKHTATPTVEMFEYVQKLICRSKKNVIEFLKHHPDYDTSEQEDLATTVIGGIKKQGLPIHVVVRPSDNGQVIVYYSSEKDTLDYENAELWIDNGKDKPRHLTLGKILKNTGINKIPVK